MDNKPLDILQIINLMFYAAAVEHYLNEFMVLETDSGYSIEELARLLTETDVFRQRYTDMLPNAAFSIQLVENTTKNLVNAELKVWAASVIERLLEDGMSRGNVTIWVARTLAAVKVDDPQWGAAAPAVSSRM